jgi:hypothetical protein
MIKRHEQDDEPAHPVNSLQADASLCENSWDPVDGSRFDMSNRLYHRLPRGYRRVSVERLDKMRLSHWFSMSGSTQEEFGMRLILHKNHQPPHQQAQGSSPCAHT